ncbi:MAG: acyltransferase family protein [Clostridiales bacterium]|jgi:surface polysaccharide O-acyltransferase-like enzyme|nr:acyltransferase family protein [Clostridiales bacterium]
MPERDTGIELDRILMFLMVCSIHSSSYYLSLSFDVYDPKWQLANLINSFSRIAVGNFVIITGYFTCKSQAKKIYRQAKKLLATLAACAPLFYIGIVLTNKSIEPVPERLLTAFWTMVKSFLKSDGGFYHIWYVQVLLMLLLVAPFLNLLIQALDKAMFKRLIAVLLLFNSCIVTVQIMLGVTFINTDWFSSNLSLFITMYVIGAYMRIHPSEKAVGPLLPVLILLFGAFINFLYCSDKSPYIYLSPLRGFKVSYPFSSYIGIFAPYSNFFVILAAVLTFRYFSRLKIKSRVINRIAALTPTAYVLHSLVIKAINIRPEQQELFRGFALLMAAKISLAFVISLICAAIANFVIKGLGSGTRWLARERNVRVNTQEL